MMNDAFFASSSAGSSLGALEVESNVSCLPALCSSLIVCVSDFFTEVVGVGLSTLVSEAFFCSETVEVVEAAVDTVGGVKDCGVGTGETGSLCVVLEVPNNKDFILDLMRARMAIIQLFLVSVYLCVMDNVGIQLGNQCGGTVCNCLAKRSRDKI